MFELIRPISWYSIQIDGQNESSLEWTVSGHTDFSSKDQDNVSWTIHFLIKESSTFAESLLWINLDRPGLYMAVHFHLFRSSSLIFWDRSLWAQIRYQEIEPKNGRNDKTDFYFFGSRIWVRRFDFKGFVPRHLVLSCRLKPLLQFHIVIISVTDWKTCE